MRISECTCIEAVLDNGDEVCDAAARKKGMLITQREWRVVAVVIMYTRRYNIPFWLILTQELIHHREAALIGV